MTAPILRGPWSPANNHHSRNDCPDCNGFQDIPFYNALGDEIGSVICERCRSGRDDEQEVAHG